MSLISISNLFYEKDKNPILKDISLSINKGDSLSIVGKSGSGKSSLLKIISSLISPTYGSLVYKDKPYNLYNPILLRRNISYISQSSYLFGNTVLDNLSFPYKIRKESFDYTRINFLLHLVNLNEDIINKDINSISGGEKQRICLIRNLIFLPDVLLLDEITSSLDKDNSINIENLIKSLNEKGITIIWVTHNDEESYSIFNKRITMDNGMIINQEEL